MTQIKHAQICSVTPGQCQPCKTKHTQICAPLRDVRRLTYSNGAVQIRVDLELLDCQNGAFGKRSFCLGDTRYFRHFRRFPGFEEQVLDFVCRMRYQTLRRFSSRPPVFGRGQKHRFQFSKTTVSTTLNIGPSTVRAENIAEFILERAGPVILKTFLAGIYSFQTDSSSLSCKKSKARN